MRNVPFHRTFVNQNQVIHKYYYAPSFDFGNGTNLSTDGTKIYYTPTFDSSGTLLFTIENLETGEINIKGYTLDITTGTFQGGIKTPNNRIFYMPSSSRYIIYYDEILDKFEKVDYDLGGAGLKYLTGLLAQDGNIYMFGYGISGSVAEVNPQTLELNQYSIRSTGYTACVLSPNGFIYVADGFAPGLFVRFDINSKTGLSVGNLVESAAGSTGVFGGCLTSDNKWLLAPYYVNRSIVLIDLNTETSTSLFRTPAVGLVENCATIRPALDGNYYMPPMNQNYFYLIEKDTYNVRTISQTFKPGFAQQYSSGAIDPRGVIHWSSKMNLATDDLSFKRASKLRINGDISNPDFWQIPTDLSTLPTSRYNQFTNISL